MRDNVNTGRDIYPSWNTAGPDIDHIVLLYCIGCVKGGKLGRDSDRPVPYVLELGNWPPRPVFAKWHLLGRGSPFRAPRSRIRCIYVRRILRRLRDDDVRHRFPVADALTGRGLRYASISHQPCLHGDSGSVRNLELELSRTDMDDLHRTSSFQAFVPFRALSYPAPCILYPASSVYIFTAAYRLSQAP